MYKRPGSSRYYFTCVNRAGETVHLSTRVRDRQLALAMEAMVLQLGPTGQRRWDLLDAAFSGVCKLPRLYDHYVAGTLEQLRAELTDVDVAPGVQAWDAQLEDQYRGSTPRKYRHHIAGLFPREGKTYRPMSRSKLLTPGFIAGRLATVGKSRTNRRRHHECWLSACEYLTEHGYLTVNPMRTVKKPKPDASRTPHIDRYADVLKFVHAFPAGAHRAAAALREGAGMEIQAVLAMRARDLVDVEERIVWAHGAKNDHRDRQVRVDAECFEIFLAYYRSQGWMPDAPLFPLTEEQLRDVHNTVCITVRKEGLDVPAGYTASHGPRHTFAIRWLKRGVEPGLIGNNLGHADASMVMRRYGKYRPKIIDIKRAGDKAQEGK